MSFMMVMLCRGWYGEFFVVDVMVLVFVVFFCFDVGVGWYC